MGMETVGPASRRRRDLALCDHGRTPVLVEAVPGGYRARCLVCGTAGPVSGATEAARLGLLVSNLDDRR